MDPVHGDKDLTVQSTRANLPIGEGKIENNKDKIQQIKTRSKTNKPKKH